MNRPTTEELNSGKLDTICDYLDDISEKLEQLLNLQRLVSGIPEPETQQKKQRMSETKI
jgi:hypothetical protein